MSSIYEKKAWPHFKWNTEQIAGLLSETRLLQGRLIGRMEALGFSLQEEAVLRTITADVIKSSEIEGENLDQEQVRSSVARHLGMDISGSVPSDRDVDGVVELMLDATQNYSKALSKNRLFEWHSLLFPVAYSGSRKIKAGAWREDLTGPMQVISGALGRERVHFEAPHAKLLEKEMTAFISWFNEKSKVDPVLKAAIAHLWFITIHPFDDGNGRIARAISDMALAQSEKSSQRFYSLSSQIRLERKNYYDLLELTQRGDLDITSWLEWFLGCMNRSFKSSELVLTSVLRKAQFWKIHADIRFNDRQIKIIRLLLDGFHGKLNSSKWAKLTKCSQDTALRDIQDLLGKKILAKDPGGGRSTSYSLILPDASGGTHE